MSYRSLQSFKVKDYKCFLPKNDHQGFDTLKPINIIIGKNNSGKSKILEFVKQYVQANAEKPLLTLDSNVIFKKELTHQDLIRILPQGVFGGQYGFLGPNHLDHWSAVGQGLVGKIVDYSDGDIEIEDHGLRLLNINSQDAYRALCHALKSRIQNPFAGYEYYSIQAERDLQPEGFHSNNDYNLRIFADGKGLTELIVTCINADKGHNLGWQQLVEQTLLEQINSVLAPDIKFTRIYVKASTSGSWEIFLEEEHKGGIRLSDCGSGIKTVIFVMTMLYIVPAFKPDKKFIFTFEELENNLHPSLERKVLAHIRDYIADHHDTLLFLTTHSNVAIDMFSQNENAQILRAYNDGEASFIERVDNWKQKHNLLGDLGVRASDLLQANCIVWLEGPSDRIYFNKWIELFSEGTLEENLHYQCAFYGGSILSHHSLDPDSDEFIQMLKINRHAVILMDRDRSNSTDPLKERVQRVEKEAEDNDSVIAWVTAGKEVENYLPKEVLEAYFGKAVALKQYQDFAALFKKEKGVDTFDKVKFASKITGSPAYTLQALETHLDLKERMQTVIEHIERCNNYA